MGINEGIVLLHATYDDSVSGHNARVTMDSRRKVWQICVLTIQNPVQTTGPPNI